MCVLKLERHGLHRIVMFMYHILKLVKLDFNSNLYMMTGNYVKIGRNMYSYS